jgi:hypothetical protein
MILGNSVWKQFYVANKPVPYNDLNRYMSDINFVKFWSYIQDTSFQPIQNIINFTANLQL